MSDSFASVHELIQISVVVMTQDILPGTGVLLSELPEEACMVPHLQ